MAEAPSDIPTRLMAEWLMECLRIAMANDDDEIARMFDARLRALRPIIRRKAA